MRNEINSHQTLKRFDWKRQKDSSCLNLITLAIKVRRIDYDMLRDLADICRVESTLCVSIFPEKNFVRIEVY